MGDWQPRYYQENAINKVLESVGAGKKRILLTLATGLERPQLLFKLPGNYFNQNGI